jgi:2-polyprenyl-6-methoxyphenol hydroxylase-like FAD-dependent oxidoreductase
MTSPSLHVLIIGGGLGGLCLAQGLKKAGISVAVYERERTPSDRLQGYRIHIEPQGNLALHACLPPDLFEVYRATSDRPGNGLRIVTEQLREISFFPTPADEGSDPAKLDLAVSRISLRKILLFGLDNLVYFDKTFTHYQEGPDGRVTAFFGDGTSVVGDVLVGADGGHSPVRTQLLPQAPRVPTGVVAIMGKLPWTEERREALFIPGRFDGPTTILGPKGHGMFTGLFDFTPLPQAHARASADQQESAPQPALFVDTTGSYLFWALIARRDKYPFEQDPQFLDGQALQQVALMMVQGWHPHLQQMVRESDPTSVIYKPLHAATEVSAWQTKRITLLGDAIHSMPPTRGIGGNTALLDASLLAQHLIAARSGEKPLLQAIHDYEAQMITYGFAAVRESIQGQEMMVAENREAFYTG